MGVIKSTRKSHQNRYYWQRLILRIWISRVVSLIIQINNDQVTENLFKILTSISGRQLWKYTIYGQDSSLELKAKETMWIITMQYPKSFFVSSSSVIAELKSTTSRQVGEVALLSMLSFTPIDQISSITIRSILLITSETWMVHSMLLMTDLESVDYWTLKVFTVTVD